MSKSTSSSVGGVTTLGLLGVLFVGLKLTGHIDWSWWWVTSPFWGEVVIAVAILAVYAAAEPIIEFLRRY